MSMELLVNGTPYTGFLRASATVSLRTLANDFTFAASAVNGYPAIKVDDEVQVHVEGKLVLTGYVEGVDGNEEEGSHEITYSGRDRTGDFIDSDIDVLADIRPSGSLTLKRLIELVLAHLGSDLKVINGFNPKPFNEAEDIIAPQVGENAVKFVMAYARKRAALLTSNGDGDIVITQSKPTDSGAAVQSLLKSDSNNIISQNFKLKANALFSRYVRRGQLEPRALNFAGSSTSESVENQSGVSTDGHVRGGRQQVVVESESYSSGQLKDRALWAHQQAHAEATTYKCTVAGHLNSAGDLWTPNTLVQVNSYAANINRKMLVDSVTYSESEGAVTSSTLNFVERNVYTTDAAILAQRPAGDQNDAFKALG